MSRPHLHLLVSRIPRSLWLRSALCDLFAHAVRAAAPFVAHPLPDRLMKLVGLDRVYDLLDALANTLLADASKVLLFFVTCILLLALIVALIRWIGRLSQLGGVPSLGTAAGGAPVDSCCPGFVQSIDAEALGCLAENSAPTCNLLVRPGAFVGLGRPILVALRPMSEEEVGRQRATVLVGRRRTYERGPRFGLTILSEIASRALDRGQRPGHRDRRVRERGQPSVGLGARGRSGASAASMWSRCRSGIWRRTPSAG